MYMSTSSLNNKEKAVDFLKLAASGNVREAYERYVGQDFRHHNPYFKGDATSLMLAMEESSVTNPNKTLEVKLVMEEQDIVAVHSHVKQNPEELGGAVVHIFRFKDQQIIELWDVGQQIPDESPNENGMF